MSVEHRTASDRVAATSIPFFRLPAEVRFQIYGLLLMNHDLSVLCIRTEHAALWELRKGEARRRTKYRHMADRFRARTMESTYHLLQNPGIDISILSVNHRIHREASHVLYSQHIFDFGTDIESIVPFLSDLTPEALSSVKHIGLFKRALPYTRDFDSCEWRSACAFISNNMNLAQLDLMIEGGQPQQQWTRQERYSKADFDLIADFEGMEWAKQVSAIRGLSVLNVKAHMEHCPSATNSRTMAFFVDFSASIEKGFAEWLKDVMAVKAA